VIGSAHFPGKNAAAYFGSTVPGKTLAAHFGSTVPGKTKPCNPN